MKQELVALSTCNDSLVMQEADCIDIEALLEQHGGYITAQVEKLAGYHSTIGHSTLIDKDDIAQIVLIKFWQILQKKPIAHPRAYLKRMVYNEFVNVLRGQKATFSLSLNDEEEEMRDASAMLIPCEEKDLPESQVEQAEAALSCANRAAKAIGALAPRQKKAMECFLHEHLDDPGQFKVVFKTYHLNIEDAIWPTRKMDSQLLNASLSAARTNVALAINFDLKRYKRKGASYLVM